MLMNYELAKGYGILQRCNQVMEVITQYISGFAYITVKLRNVKALSVKGLDNVLSGLFYGVKHTNISARIFGNSVSHVIRNMTAYQSALARSSGRAVSQNAEIAPKFLVHTQRSCAAYAIGD